MPDEPLKMKTPSYRRHRPSGQAVVTLNGRDIYLGVYRSLASRREYDRVIAEWLANGRHLPTPEGQSAAVTVTVLIARYWREHARTYYVKNGKPSGEQWSLKLAFRPLNQLYGNTLANDFGPLKLEAVRNAMIAAGWCRKTINDSVHRIRRLFRWGVRKEIVPATVHQALLSLPALAKGRSAAPDREPVRPVPDAHVDAIKPHVSPVIWAMIELQRLTGMRPGEVTIMRTRDIDTSGTLWEYRPHTHKTEYLGDERVIPLGPRAQAVLRPFLRPDLEAFIFDPRDSVAQHRAKAKGHRRPNQKPTRRKTARRLRPLYGVNEYRHAIARGCQKADAQAHRDDPTIPADKIVVPVWKPNQLRHSAATRIRKNLGLEAAQVVLGHRSADVTQIYAERNMGLARDIAAKLG